MKIRVIERRAKSLYTRSKIPGVGWAVNQYVGCAFVCEYCYAKFLTRWKDYGRWGSWVGMTATTSEFTFVPVGPVLRSAPTLSSAP
ncbi:hypothetical protein [Thermococcus sp. JdF3]|uniref:hypothetical protein n=1 Tax=Thermococcus sp. JdF3 TaxID=1638258 RepID=UPI00351ACCCF